MLLLCQTIKTYFGAPSSHCVLIGQNMEVFLWAQLYLVGPAPSYSFSLVENPAAYWGRLCKPSSLSSPERVVGSPCPCRFLTFY